jgi:hypothetical protein
MKAEERKKPLKIREPPKNVCPKKRGINLQNNKNTKNLEPFERRALITPRPHPKKTTITTTQDPKNSVCEEGGEKKSKFKERRKKERKKERKLRKPKKTHTHKTE